MVCKAREETCVSPADALSKNFWVFFFFSKPEGFINGRFESMLVVI
jgi:hypothetical protein